MTLPRAKKNHPGDGGGTRQRLLEAARLEFSERGIERAATRRIAQRAGCNEVTLFRHFESKQKLLAAVVQGTSEECRMLCECRELGSGDVSEDLEWFARTYSDSLERHQGMVRAIIGEAQHRPNLAKELIGDTITPFHRRISEYLIQQQGAGRIRSDVNTEAFAEIMTASLLGGMLRRGSGLSEFDRESWLRETISTFVNGILA